MEKTKKLLFEVEQKIKNNKNQRQHWEQVRKMLKQIEEAELTFYHEHKKEVSNG